MITILVTGAGGSAAANFVRSLRMHTERSYRLIGVDTRPAHLHATLGLDERLVVPRADDPRYLASLDRLCARFDVDLVHPQPDVEVAALADVGVRVGSSGARLALPSAPVVALCQDKLACQQRLADAGVSVPVSVAAGDEQAEVDRQVTALAERSPDGLVWVRALRGAGSRAALPVRTGAQAAAWMEYWSDMRGVPRTEFMLAQHLPGDEHAFQSLWWDGQLVTSAARRRTEYLFGHLTPSGQTSTPAIAVSVHDPAVNDTAVAAVRAVAERPHGVFCVDLKADADGRPCVTEINAGRFFTTSDFFAAAGANMPAAYVELALGLERTVELPDRNAVPADTWWVRNIDKAPALVPGAAWDVQPAEAAIAAP